MDVTEVGAIAARIRAEVSKAVIGQTETVDLMLTALFCGGHILLEGPPGTAKTLLAQTFARTLSLQFGRIQFTPDLMPGDILGSNIFNFQTSTFTLTRGPVFCDLLLADEINRTPPKTQAALLEAMQERSVTVDGDTHVLSDRFTVIATQNPIEQSGTFELPEAQLDRFMLCHRLTYPTLEEEQEVLRRNLSLGLKKDADGHAVARTEFDVLAHAPVGGPADLVRVMEKVQDVHVSETFQKHVLALVHRTRHHPSLELGCSPRGGIALTKAARARAFLHSRDYAVPEDLFALAEDVVLHRIRLRYEALAEGQTGASVLAEILG